MPITKQKWRTTDSGSHEALEGVGIRTAVCSAPDYYVNFENKHYYLPRIDAVEYSKRRWWFANPLV